MYLVKNIEFLKKTKFLKKNKFTKKNLKKKCIILVIKFQVLFLSFDS